MRCYAPAVVLAVFALLVTAGVTGDAVVVLFLLIEAVAVADYIHQVRSRLKKKGRRRAPA